MFLYAINSSLKWTIKSESFLSIFSKRWATNLGGGSTQNGRDSAGRRLGIKKGNGAQVKVPEVIVRQRGFQYHPGEHIGVGKDHTLYALKPGTVKFTRDYGKHRTIVSVVPPPGPPPRSFLLQDVSEYAIRT